MATEIVTLTAACAAGGHLTFTLTGAKEATVQLRMEQLSEPVSDEEIEVFCKIIGRLAKSGRTNAQARSVLQAGVTVTV
jgi:hypothetical protein